MGWYWPGGVGVWHCHREGGVRAQAPWVRGAHSDLGHAMLIGLEVQGELGPGHGRRHQTRVAVGGHRQSQGIPIRILKDSRQVDKSWRGEFSATCTGLVPSDCCCPGMATCRMGIKGVGRQGSALVLGSSGLGVQNKTLMSWSGWGWGQLGPCHGRRHQTRVAVGDHRQSQGIPIRILKDSPSGR